MPRSRHGHRLACECGFVVEGDEDEVVEVAHGHARRVHGIELADGIVRALARPLQGDLRPHTRQQRRSTEG